MGLRGERFQGEVEGRLEGLQVGFSAVVADYPTTGRRLLVARAIDSALLGAMKHYGNLRADRSLRGFVRGLKATRRSLGEAVRWGEVLMGLEGAKAGASGRVRELLDEAEALRGILGASLRTVEARLKGFEG